MCNKIQLRQKPQMNSFVLCTSAFSNGYYCGPQKNFSKNCYCFKLMISCFICFYSYFIFIIQFSMFFHIFSATTFCLWSGTNLDQNNGNRIVSLNCQSRHKTQIFLCDVLTDTDCHTFCSKSHYDRVLFEPTSWLK